jgi:hypothetical protein
MSVIKRIVDNRVFLLGLDFLYREAIKTHERGELLECARRVASTLDVPPADVPVEGYYAEEELLTQYFRLVRGLQNVSADRARDVSELPEFLRLKEVTSAPLFGTTKPGDGLLPAGEDALTKALDASRPKWKLGDLVSAANTIAIETNDISLVGLAARISDPVVLCALRESVVLYDDVSLGMAGLPPTYEYVWNVDEDLSSAARRFIDTFNSLFSTQLPGAESSEAETFWNACENNELVGRCVRIGLEDRVSPVQHYHWALYRGPDRKPVAQEFWSPRIWTTSDYSAQIYQGNVPLNDNLTTMSDSEFKLHVGEEQDPNPFGVRPPVSQSQTAKVEFDEIVRAVTKEKLGEKPWWRIW